MRTPRHARNERGIALLIVLMLAVVLIPFAGEFAYQIQFEARMSQNVTHQMLLDKAIDGQREIVLAQIEYDAPNNETDTYEDDWNREDMRQRSEQLGAGREDAVTVDIRTTVFDEQGKFNLLLLSEGSDELRRLHKARLVELLKQFRRDTKWDAGTYADELADDIFSWLNGGAMRGDIPRPKTIDGRPMLVLDELHFASDRVEKERVLEDVREGDEIAPGLHRYVTVYGNGKINLNTADPIVLRAVWSQDPDVADRIAERRQGQAMDEDQPYGEEEDEEGASGEPFTDVMQVNELDGVNTAVLNRNQVELSRDFDVRSNHFSMWISAATDITRRDERIVVERVPSSDPNAGIDGFRFLLHQERTDPLEEIQQDR